MTDYPIKTPQQLGSVLKGYRKEQRLTQRAVGAKVGLAQNAVSQIEAEPGSAGLRESSSYWPPSILNLSCGRGKQQAASQIGDVWAAVESPAPSPCG